MLWCYILDTRLHYFGILFFNFGIWRWKTYTSIYIYLGERKKKEGGQWKKCILTFLSYNPYLWKTKDGLSNAPMAPTVLTSEPKGCAKLKKKQPQRVDSSLLLRSNRAFSLHCHKYPFHPSLIFRFINSQSYVTVSMTHSSGPEPIYQQASSQRIQEGLSGVIWTLENKAFSTRQKRSVCGFHLMAPEDRGEPVGCHYNSLLSSQEIAAWHRQTDSCVKDLSSHRALGCTEIILILSLA